MPHTVAQKPEHTTGLAHSQVLILHGKDVRTSLVGLAAALGVWGWGAMIARINKARDNQQKHNWIPDRSGESLFWALCMPRFI